MKNLTKIIGIILVFTFVFGLSGCKKSNKETTAPTKTSTEKSKVRFAPIQNIPGTNFRYGYEKGAYSANDLDVDFVTLGDDTRVGALTSGEVDVAEMNTSQAIAAIGKGAPIKIVASMYRTVPAWYLVGNKSIENVKGLKGKTITISSFGTGFDLALREILSKNGLKSQEDVNILALGGTVGTQMGVAIESGKTDATMASNPVATMIEKKDEGKIIAYVKDYTPLLHTGVIVATDGFIAKHPELVTKMIDLYFSCTSYAKNHLDDFIKYSASANKLDVEIQRAATELDLPVWADDPKVNVKALKWTQDKQFELGFQDKKYDIDSMLNLNLIPKKTYK